MYKLKIFGIAALLAVAGTGVGAQPTAEAESTANSDALGMYVGFQQGARFAEYEKALGGPLRWSVIMAGSKSAEQMRSASWGQLASSDAYLPAVSDRVNLVITIPLAFGSGGQSRTVAGQEVVGKNLRDTAAGQWDADYRVVARYLKEAGYGDAVIRLGHEFDGDWSPHSARNNNEAYIAAFRHVHDVLQSESAKFTFDWTSMRAHFQNYGPPAYPGDAYVDVVGMDIYYRDSVPISDQVWERQYLPVLEAHREFARSHGKPVSYPEWGRAFGTDSRFVDRMHGWLSSLPASGPGGLLYHSYFNERDKNYDLNGLPNVKQRYLELFAASGTSPAPSPAPVSPPATTVTTPAPIVTTPARQAQPSLTGEFVVELPEPPESVTPSRGTAVQITETVPPPSEDSVASSTPSAATQPAPIVTTPPRSDLAVPVGVVTAAARGTSILPSILVLRDDSSIALSFSHDDAKLFNIRHRPTDSTWWKWEVQTRSTTLSLPGIDGRQPHVIEVKAFVAGKWQRWNSVTVRAAAAPKSQVGRTAFVRW